MANVGLALYLVGISAEKYILQKKLARSNVVTFPCKQPSYLFYKTVYSTVKELQLLQAVN